MVTTRNRRPFTARRGRTASLRFTLPCGGLIVAGALCLMLFSLTGETVAAAVAMPTTRPVTARTQPIARTLPHASRCHAPLPMPGTINEEALEQQVGSARRAWPRARALPCLEPGIAAPLPLGTVPHVRGQLILVSVSQQWLWALQDGRLVFSSPVTTGRPGLRTPLGTYTVEYKLADVTFTSPWPASSPNYYAPEHVNYALNFLAGGFFIHDEPGREGYGPGSEDPHLNPDGSVETGTHGCVNMPVGGAAWLYSWAQVGATVLIR